MLTDSSLQPLAFALFFLGGAAAYVSYEILRALRFQARLPVFMHITDAFFAVGVSLVFVFLTHFFYAGIIKYYTLFCFALGFFSARLILKPPVRRFLQFVKTQHKKHILLKEQRSKLYETTTTTIQETTTAKTANIAEPTTKLQKPIANKRGNQ
jgi:hypothetical protein